MKGIVRVNGQDIGEVELNSADYTIGVDPAMQGPDSTVVAMQRFASAARNVGRSMEQISYNIRMNTKRFNRVIKGLFPNSLWAKGYKIVNHRGRNKLVKL